MYIYHIEIQYGMYMYIYNVLVCSLSIYLLCHLSLYSAEDNLAKIEATYGSGSCLLLHINSRRPDSVVLGDNPWSRVASHCTAGNSTHQVGHWYIVHGMERE